MHFWKDLEKIQRHLSAIAGHNGFMPLGTFAECHGSFQIDFCKTEAAATSRFVTVSVTEESDGAELLVEVYATVENQTCSGRKQVVSFLVNPLDLSTLLLRESFKESFENGLREADLMNPASLKAVHFFPPVQAACAASAET